MNKGNIKFLLLFLPMMILSIYQGNLINQKNIELNSKSETIAVSAALNKAQGILLTDQKNLYESLLKVERERSEFLRDNAEYMTALDPLRPYFTEDERIEILKDIKEGSVFHGGKFHVTYGFRERKRQEGRYKLHPGGDMVPVGSDWYITPFAAGEVVNVADDIIYGKCITIRHSERFETFYAHNNTIYDRADVGQMVGPDDVIALMGNTGDVYSSEGGDGSHLHLEFRFYISEGFYVCIDPIPFLVNGMDS